MELTKDFTAEQVQFGKEHELLQSISQQVPKEAPSSYTTPLTQPDLFQKVECVLLDRKRKGNKEAYFQLGILYFEQGNYEKAYNSFESSKDFDCRSLYQMSVMLYDGIGVNSDTKMALAYMMKLLTSNLPLAERLLPSVRFNIGRAYFQGYGPVRASEEEALRWWLMAADDGNPQGSVKAQSILGMYFSRQFYSLDLKKAFFGIQRLVVMAAWNHKELWE